MAQQSSVHLSGQVVTVVLFTAALSSLRSGFRPALFYLIAFGVFLLAAFVFFFKFYGLIPNNTFTMHIVIFGSAAEAILLSFALATASASCRRKKNSCVSGNETSRRSA